MNLRFQETTRGKGRIFVHLSGTSMPPDVRLKAHATTKGGGETPAMVLTVPEVEGWVLVLPVLTVTQHVVVRVLDAHGTELASFHKTVAARAAMLHSRVNTATHNAVAERIRNSDRAYTIPGVYVRLTELVWNATQGCDVVHGIMRVRSTSRDEAAAPLELRCLGTDGTNISLAPWINMGDSLVERHNAFERTVSFSVSVPMEHPALVLWAASPQSDVDDGFVCYEDFVVWGFEQRWRNKTIAPGAANHDEASNGYQDWFDVFQRLSARDAQVQRARTFREQLLFSVVVPLFRTPLAYLRDMVDSVLSQTYGNFELLLVNASPEDEALAQAVDAYAQADDRIRPIALPQNLGITQNTLAGIAQATGDFVCFLDHDDVIEPDLLWCYMDGIERYPTTDLLYCDEDKLLDGRLIAPTLKGDWNLDLLRSQNYVCHMLTVRKDIVDELPADAASCEGTFDHYLTLFASESARNIYHARKVLYHWRIHAQSTASGGEAKSYTTASGVRAIQAHLDRCGIAATVSPRSDVPNTYRVDYAVEGEPLVSIVIPNKDMVPILSRCIDSIRTKSTYGNYEIVVVENNSTDPATFAYYDEVEAATAAAAGVVRVLRQPSDGTFNFALSSNYGAEYARGEYLVFLNNDTEVITPDWIERMLGQCQRADVGCVGAKLLYPDGLIQHAGVVVHKGVMEHIGKKLDRASCEYLNSLQVTQDLSAVTAACMMMRRSTFERVGRFDELLANDFNDTDLCLRLRDAGLLVVYEPLVELLHYESISRGEHETDFKMRQYSHALGVMMQRWPKNLGAGDPYWNPNLVAGSYKVLYVPERIIYE